MGCSASDREKIEKEMMMLKIERIGIRKERMDNIKMLGESYRDCKDPIPDYIDPAFAVLRGIYNGNEIELGIVGKNEVRSYQKSVTFKNPHSRRKNPHAHFNKCEPQLRKVKTDKEK